jgi:hypothetical protein
MKRYEDQSALVHLAGARGSDYNIEWAVRWPPTRISRAS